MSDYRKIPLAAAVNDGRLVVSIGLDTLDELRKRLGVDYDRVSVADIGDFLINSGNTFYDGRSPFEDALVDAADRAKAWDDNNEETTEPSTEFVR